MQDDSVSEALLRPIAPDVQKRILAIAQIRGEPVEEILHRYSRAQLQRMPSRYPKALPLVMREIFSSTGLLDDLAYAALPNGRVFYGFPSNERQRYIYSLVADKLSKVITENTLAIALDVVFRYSSRFNWPPEEVAPAYGDTVVELGSYLGHKAVRFADCVGPNGKVLAVEMMPDNYAMLRRNIEANRLNGICVPVECGVWSEPSRLAVRSRGGRQQNSVSNLEKLSETTLHVKVDSLDNIAQHADIEVIDFLYITVNGSELEALTGAQRMLPRTRKVFINAPYTVEGIDNAARCREILSSSGFRLVSGTDNSHVCGIRG